MKKNFFTLFIILFMAIPCFSEEFTLGMVQQRIHPGMAQAEIVSCLGAPNMVTKNSEGCETWVYDKTSHSSKEVYDKRWFWFFITGRRRGCQSTETSQKTLTVTLNFDRNACLESYTYNTNNF